MLLCLPLLALAVPPAAWPDPGGGPAATPAPRPSPANPLRASAAGLTLALATASSRANPKDLVVVTVYFNNTGNQAAPGAWINVTAASGFTFAWDTAAGNLSGYPRYSFQAVGLGTHSFQIAYLVNVGVAPGTRLSVSATLVYSDGTGGQQFVGPSAVSVWIGIATKQLYLGWSGLPPTVLTPIPPTGGLLAQGTFTLTRGGPALNFDLSPGLARPFRVLNLTVTLYMQPLATPTGLDVNLTLVDVNGGATAAVAWKEQVNSITGSGYWTLIYTFPSLDYTFPAGHAIRLQILNTLASGQSTLLATNATAEPSRLDLQTTTVVSVDSLTPASSPPTYLSPKSALTVLANVSDPFGSREISDVRLNVTGPLGRLANWTSLKPAVLTDASSPSAWALFRYVVNPPLPLGTYTFEATAVERNGVVDVAASSATVRAPAFTFVKVSSVNQAKSGTRFTYTIFFNNTGTGPAGQVWVNDTLPSVVNYVSSSVPFGSNVGNTYGWVFSAVGVGSHNVTVTVQVKGGSSGVGYIRNWAFLNFTDPQGFRWPASVSHADVVLNGPVLALAVSSVPSPHLHSNESVVFLFNLTNAGDAAQSIWLNDTLPTGMTYVGDTSATLGGSSTVLGNRVNVVFSNMPSGAPTPVTWRFNVTARADPGLIGGTVLTSRVVVNDSSTNGLLMPELVTSLSLTVGAPAFTSSGAGFGVATAVPRVPLPVYVNFTNSGNEAAGTVWINLTLDPSLTFRDATAPATVAGSVVLLTVSNEPVGPASIRVNVTASFSVTDRQTLTVDGTLDAVDGYGNHLPRVVFAEAAVPVALPAVSFRLTPGDARAEVGSLIVYAVDGGNAGSGTAAAVWLNVTLPANLVYVGDTFGATRSSLGSAYSWSWPSYAPGAHTYTLSLRASLQAANGSSANLTFFVEAQDAGFNMRPLTTFRGNATFTAPTLLLTASVDRGQALPNTNLTYTLRVSNEGATAASFLNLTDPLDPHLQVVTYSVPAGVSGTGALTWQFRDLQPGQAVTVVLLVKVLPGTPASVRIANVLEAEYTNSWGVPLGSLYSAPATTTIQADLTGLLAILVGGAGAGGLVVFVVYRRYRVHIEDVFLIYRDGILISHLTQADVQEKDEDQLSGMLTAVQDFVQDAFTYGRDRELHQLEFGDYHILIERGKHVYLAVVYQGRDSGLIRKKVRTVRERVEAAYGSVFDTWDGDMGQVEATRDLLREGFLETDRPWSLVRPKAP